MKLVYVALTAFSMRTPLLRRASMLAASANDEAEALMEKVRLMRKEIASLEGKSVEDVEQEAREKKEIQAEVARQRESARNEARSSTSPADGSFLNLPETPDDQVSQAKGAIERAFKAGLTRQVVRWALIPEGEVLNVDRQWPGGAKQMYREAAGPLTRELLRDLKAPTSEEVASFARNNVTSQDVWDFDGSALVTALSPSGASGDIQALVLPNTDNKYLKDIETLDAVMKERLFLLVNPFWRNVDSWGFNLLAPKAKENAQRIVFDGGFTETYCLLQTSARGESCFAVKAYPYDWQLFAYAEQDYWPYAEYPIRLGSTKDEPTTADFGALLEKREEFRLSKNMRQMQRRMGGDNNN